MQQDSTRRRFDNWKIILILGAFFLLHLPFLTSYPPVDILGDESWFMDHSVNILRRGSPSGTMFIGTPLNEPTPLTAWLYNGLLSLAFYIGGPGLLAGRLLSLFAQMIVIYFTARIGRLLFSEATGILSAILLGSSVFFANAHQLRPEALFTAGVSLSLFLFYHFLNTDKPLSLFLSFLSGGLLIEVHPNGIVYVFCLFLLYLLWYRRLLNRNSLFVLIGVLVPSLLWFLINYLPYRSFSSFQTVHREYTPALLRGFKDYVKVLLNFFVIDYNLLFERLPIWFLNNFDMRIYVIAGMVGLIYCLFNVENKRSLYLILSTIAAFLKNNLFEKVLFPQN